MRYILRFIAISLVCVLAIISIDTNRAFAQGWTKLHTFDGYISLAKFLDAKTGFVGLGISLGAARKGPVEIDKTTDGGVTWIRAAIPPGYNGEEGEIADILMVDSLNGWAAICCRGNNGNKALWHTTDGGLSWIETPLIGVGTSVRITSRAMIVTDIEGNLHISTDGGSTFTDDLQTGTNCADFVDPLHGAISVFRGQNWLYSGDGGLTWQSSTMDIESWSVHGDSGTSKFYAAPEGPTNGAPYISNIYKSTDFGVAWNAIATLPFLRFTGHLEGVGDQYLFAQADALLQPTPTDGFYYSKDAGVTWTGISGPIALNDTRFSVLNECQGITVYAFDTLASGSLFQYRFNTSINTNPNGIFEFSSNPVTASATLCEDTVCGLRLRYSVHCDSAILLSLRLLDSNSIAVTNGAFGFDTLPRFPLIMRDGTEDSIGFYWNPSGKFYSDTSISLRLEVRYYNEITHINADTIIDIRLNATSVPLNFTLSPQTIDMGAVSSCSEEDTTVTLCNLSCFPLAVDSIGLEGTGFELLDSSVSAIAPGDSTKIRVRFIPSGTNNFFGKLSFYLADKHSAFPPNVEFRGSGVQGEGILAIDSTSLNAGSFSFCAGDTSVASVISNSGCDTLVISDVRFTGDGTFTLSSQPSDSLLAPNSLSMFGFNFAPRLKGGHSAEVTFHSRNLHGSDPGHDTTITVSGFGLDGTTMLSVDSTPRNLGSIYLCQQRDTSITLYNSGCDTLTVNSDSIYNSAYSSNSTYPITIPPGDSSVVQVSLEPRDSVLNGSISFLSNADSGSRTVTIRLHANLIYPATLRLVLSPSDSAFAGQTVTCYILLDGRISGNIISAMHFDIAHNDDLLSFLGYSGAGLSLDTTIPAVGIVNQSFALSPIPASDTIGTLKFKVYLTDSSNTSLSLSKISFVSPLDLPSDCIASIGDSDASFTYLYRCGDKIIQGEMEGDLRFSIISIQPNPAQTSITVTLSGVGGIVGDASGSGINVEMFDVLGQTILTQHSALSTQHLDVSKVSPGTYILRLSENGFVQSREVAIER